MAKKEKFGKFILLEELDTSGLGSEYRAAKLSGTGLEKIVTLLRLNATLSANTETARDLMDQAKIAAQLQNPNVMKIFGIGKVDAAYYISYEFLEGKSLKAIFARCRQEGFPFSVDHTLLIASKICSALEYAHSRKTDGGRYFHGFLNPAAVLVSYEGEVRVGGFGYWPSHIREAGAVTEAEASYLAPEQAAGGVGDTKSDIFTVGAILFETLTGRRLFEGGRTADIPGRLASAKLQSPTTEDDSIPKPIAEILSRSLSVEPSGRYGEVQEMRKAIDTLLFSGDFTPTTFNLAFFMHSLFREDIERESKALKEDREGSYLDFLTDEVSKTVVLPTRPATGTHSLPLIPPPPRPEPEHKPATPSRQEGTVLMKTPLPVSAPPAHEEPAPGATAREAAAGFTFHKDEKKAAVPVLPALAVLLLLAVAGGGYYYYAKIRVPAAPPTTTLSPAAIAEEAKVKELEAKIKEMEDEKAAAEQKAKDEATAKLQKEAKAKGSEVDAAALQKAQEEAAKKARLEQEKKQEEERKRIEEQKKAEEARLAEEQRKAAEAAVVAAAVTTPPAPSPTPPPSTLPAAGSLVNLNDAGVIAPIAENRPQLVYPPIALRQHMEGTVELNVLIDEKGSVVDATVVSGPAGSAGLNEAAIENVKRRKYRPATKEGVPVKVWIPVRVAFVLPKT